MLQDSSYVKQKQRSGLLTGWLVLVIIASLISIAIVIPKGSPAFPDVIPGWQIAAVIVGGVFNIVCAAALFMWKKWGFWGFCASIVITFIVNILVGEMVIISLIRLLVQLFVLYLIFTAGGDKRAWPQLE